MYSINNITGSIKGWDNTSQSFISKSSDTIKKNKMFLDLKLKYQKIAEEWEKEGRKWSSAELALNFDKKKGNKEGTEKSFLFRNNSISRSTATYRVSSMFTY